MRTILLFIMMVAGAEATCARYLSTNIIRCPSTGDANADGQNLFDLFNNVSFNCGDVIILDAGAEYIGLVSNNTLRIRTKRCTISSPVRITSTRCSEIPPDTRVTTADFEKMAIVAARSSIATIEFWENVGGYIFECVRFTNTKAWADAFSTTPNIIAQNAGSIANRASAPRDITFDRVAVYPRDVEYYGNPTNTNTDGRACHQSSQTGFAGVSGYNWVFKNSLIYGFNGIFLHPTATTFTSISNASPARVTHTGIAAALGVSTGQYRNACFIGATGNWLTLNGAVWLKYVDADNVDIYKPATSSPYNSAVSVAFDSSAMGALTGTVVLRKSNVDGGAGISLPNYGFYLNYGTVKVINNTIQSWGMNVFTGGTDAPADDPATLQSGSTSTVLKLNHVRGLNVGDMITVRHGVTPAAPSAYCYNSGYGCWGTNSMRAGLVTAISGTDVTVTPYGTDGIDIAPVAGGEAIWRGPYLSLEMRGNTIERVPGLLTPQGKGFMEVKQMEYSLIDGNISSGTPVGSPIFVTVHNQAGYAPWSRINMSRISNNVVDMDPPPSTWVMNTSDPEHSSEPRNMLAIYEHNIQPATSRGDIFQGINMKGGTGFRHNTVFTTAGVTPSRLFAHADCYSFGATGVDRQSIDGAVRDNIASFGSGSLIPNALNNAALSCWPNFKDYFTGNLFIDTQTVGTSTITTNYPGNSAVANTTGLFAGTCIGTSWENCALDSGSAYRGTATDGGDPGADVQQVKDRVNRWSEKAGLIEASTSTPGMILRPGNWQIGSTSVAMTFRLFDSIGENCTVELFTVRNRTGEHDDAASPQVCDRTGSVTNGSTITYIHGTTSPLTPNTTYFYRINDGATRKLVGEFTTLPAGSGISRTWSRAMECGPDQAFGVPVAAGATFSMSSGDVRYCRESSPVGSTKVLVAR